MMVVRKIVKIDKEKCNGCGLCVPACHEGAIEIIDGKARVVDDKFCDGLGDCLGECPLGAITIIEREAVEYDEEAVQERITILNQQGNHQGINHSLQAGKHIHHEDHGGGCPGSRMMDMRGSKGYNEADKIEQDRLAVENNDLEIRIKSQLNQWPVQLNLTPEKAPYFENAELLLTADCVPFAYPNFHLDLLKGKTVVTGCPKLDDAGYYLQKLTEIVNKNNLKGITVAFMEVPCCTGIVRIIEEAIIRAGKNIPLNKVRISINGQKIPVS